jgi:hypothetical protein
MTPATVSDQISNEPLAKFKTKPLFLIKPGTIKASDLKRIEKECGIVIAECKEPDAVRLLEPPIGADIDEQSRAALTLFRYIAEGTVGYSTTFYGATLIRFFVNALLEGAQPKRVEKVKK